MSRPAIRLHILPFFALLCVAIAAALSYPNITNAQQAPNYETRLYNDLVKDVVTSRDIHPYQFVRLRRYYSETPFYSPDATPIIEQMNTLAPLIKPGSTDKKDINNFDTFQNLMLSHMGNMDVVNNAVLLSQTYSNILNTGQLKYILNGLIQSLTLDGDGNSYKTAYSLYSLSEEIALLQYLGATLINKTLVKKNSYDYAVYKVKIGKSEQFIFADISPIVNQLKTEPLTDQPQNDIPMGR